MKPRSLLGLLPTFFWLFGIQISSAQTQQPVVYAVLFFSPSCGHCHYVITETLPPLKEEYDEQLQVLYIDVSQPAGGTLFFAACETFDVPADRCGYVPTLVIGETVLVGSSDIPDQMPSLVRNGIASGGTDLPPIPGLREAYETAVSNQQLSDTQDDLPESAPISTTYREMTWQDRLNQDRLGNGLAVGVLGILSIGLLVQMGHGARLLVNESRYWEVRRFGWVFVLGLGMITTSIAGTLVLENDSFSLPTILAASVTCGMVLVLWGMVRSDRQTDPTGHGFPGWLIPVISSLGLVVASYLAYVEIIGNEAVCGAVGDCNTVQQSEYAKVFGLIPIGLLGVVGYVMILTAWLVGRRGDGCLADTAQALLLGFSVFGTSFSIYLTFLEPFVIGATCAWCLTSAMLMILILCLQAPTGWIAVNRLVDKLTHLPDCYCKPD